MSRQQRYEAKRIIEKDLNHCCNTTKKKKEISTILAVEHNIMAQNDKTTQNIGLAAIQFF